MSHYCIHAWALLWIDHRGPAGQIGDEVVGMHPVVIDQHAVGKYAVTVQPVANRLSVDDRCVLQIALPTEHT